TTDASGQAVFANLLPGSYTYDIAAIGFQEKSGSLTVTDEDVVLDVMIEHLIFVPTSLYFDGTDEYVQTSYPGVLGANRRTFQAWIYLDAAPSVNLCIIDYGTNAGGKRNTFMVAASGKLAYLSGTSTGNLSATDALVPLGSWVHVAFAFDGINGFLYQNGVLVGTASLPGINTSTGTNLRIGERVTDGSIPFKGMIDEVCIWNVALTQQEIIDYACIDDPMAYNNLVACYNFNEGSGATLHDLKSGYNGTLMNMEEEDWIYNDGCEGKFYPKGWSGISSNMIPVDKIMMEDLFAPVLDKMVILIGTNGIFWPGQNLNTIGDWDTYQGYKVKYNYAVDFVIEGAELTDRTVTLQPGNVYIPVLSLEPASVEDVLVPHGTAIEYVFDVLTQEIYWPTGGIVPGVEGALETLVPGYAYLALINNTVTLDFDVPVKSGTEPVAGNHFVNTTNWNDVTRTGSQHVISVTAANLDEGDVVGVFAADGTCTGMAQYNGVDEILPLVVNGNDLTTTLKDGMIQNELMSFKIFRHGKEFEVCPVYNQNIANHDGLFAENGLSIINDFKMGATSVNAVDALIFSVIPNPSNGKVKITMADIEACEISVMNMKGQKVYSAQANGSTFLDLSKQPSGVYFIRISNATSTSIEKIVIE
nr:T9SS type A sorting domain-containing protein [Bacteroidota bacterium]